MLFQHIYKNEDKTTDIINLSKLFHHLYLKTNAQALDSNFTSSNGSIKPDHNQVAYMIIEALALSGFLKSVAEKIKDENSRQD